MLHMGNSGIIEIYALVDISQKLLIIREFLLWILKFMIFFENNYFYEIKTF